MANNTSVLGVSNQTSWDNWYYARKFPPAQPDATDWDQPSVEAPFPGPGVTNQTVTFTGVSSRAAFGTAKLNRTIRFTGLVSRFAAGTAKLNRKIVFTGLASRFVAGTGKLNMQVRLTGLASRFAAGNATIANQGMVNLIGVPSRQAIGLASIAGPVQFTGLASRFAAGIDKLNMQVRLSGLASHFATGTAQLNRQIRFTGVTTRQAIGTANISGPITFVGLPSRQSIGADKLNMSVKFVSVPSREAIGDASIELNGKVTLHGVPSRQAFGHAAFVLDTGVLAGAAANRSGPTTGGQVVFILAPGADMESVEDTFETSTIDATRWTTSTTGSALALDRPAANGDTRGQLQLVTGRTPGSSAVIRSKPVSPSAMLSADPARMDVGATAALQPRLFGGGAMVAFTLGLYISETTYCRLSVSSSSSSSATLHVLAVENGMTSIDFETVMSSVSLADVELRILKVDSQVYTFVNGHEFLDLIWTSKPALVEMRADNDLIIPSSITASVTKYTRNPVILFDDQPVRQVLSKSKGRVNILTPPHTKSGVVPVHFTNSATTFDVADTYEYVNAVDYRQVGIVGQSTLISTSDNVVRN